MGSWLARKVVVGGECYRVGERRRWSGLRLMTGWAGCRVCAMALRPAVAGRWF